MILEYIDAALRKAEYRKLEDGTWYAEIPGFNGVWANSESVENCRGELSEVLEEWILLKVRDAEEVPIIDGVMIKFKEEAVA